MDIQVVVDYTSSLKKVIEKLAITASLQPIILKYPQSQVLFTEFGDSAINYELRAWTNEYIDWPKIKSELAISVYAALQDAGMSIPFPQRVVHMLKDDE